MKKEPFRCRILVAWSDEDQAFIARVPALPGCFAHGGVPARDGRGGVDQHVDVVADRGGVRPAGGAPCRGAAEARTPRQAKGRGVGAMPRKRPATWWLRRDSQVVSS